jgi:hypothetical protein
MSRSPVGTLCDYQTVPGPLTVLDVVDLAVKLEDDATTRLKLNQGFEFFQAAVADDLIDSSQMDQFAWLLGQAIEKRGWMGFTTTGGGSHLAPDGAMWSSRELQARFGYYITADGYQVVAAKRQRETGGGVSSSPMPDLLVSSQRAQELLERFITQGGDLVQVGRHLQSEAAYKEWGLEETRWRKLTTTALASIYGEGTSEIDEFAKTNKHFVYSLGGPWPEYRDGDVRDADRAINVLRSFIERLEFANEPPGAHSPRTGSDAVLQATGPPVIFLVHGRDHGVRETVARFLEKAGGYDVVILDEQAGKGRTLVEKFEQHASAANYAVVLLTADDIGGPADTKEISGLQKRARQNVVFELGFFWGKIGRDRVAVLLDTGVEKPSDIDGLNYISIDEAGGWKGKLVKELVAADLDFDAARA